MSQLDIRVGTMAGIDKAPHFIRQVIGHGFESFQLTGGWGVGVVDFKRIASETFEAMGDRAVVSALGYYGNPLLKEEDARNFGAYIDHARTFNTDLVCGFAGALDGKPLAESLPAYKKVWGELARRAADKGVRIAFENCDMGGWHHAVQWNIAHAPSTWEILFNEVPSESIGLEWEPCHQMVSLIDPLPQLRQWVKKVFHVHGKDATLAWDVVRTAGIRGGKPYVWHRTPGFGDTNWSDVITILRMNGFRGAIDIEGYHDPVYRGDLEMTGQAHALRYLKQCRGGDFVPNPSK